MDILNGRRGRGSALTGGVSINGSFNNRFSSVCSGSSVDMDTRAKSTDSRCCFDMLEDSEDVIC